MEIYSINTGLFKLDGGAMFGIVPKTIWQKFNKADENNLCSWAMRCLLIKDGNRNILIDTGCGNKQSEHFFKYYFLHGNDSLIKSIENTNTTIDEITDVILTHLHFDHVGGACQRNVDNPNLIEPTFPNANYWVHLMQWEQTLHPNRREKASFLSENYESIFTNGQLKFLTKDEDFGHPSFSFLVVNGHTSGMLVPKILVGTKTICFLADLIPSMGHISLAYLAAYDVEPLVAIQEKETFLKEACENNYILFFEHDPQTECCTVKQSPKGIVIDKTFNLKD
jgi:glyoxylase-like metal-dependent hydrolase (beta-lactamase superfamily II)